MSEIKNRPETLLCKQAKPQKEDNTMGNNKMQDWLLEEQIDFYNVEERNKRECDSDFPTHDEEEEEGYKMSNDWKESEISKNVDTSGCVEDNTMQNMGESNMNKSATKTYMLRNPIGTGSFGTVFEAVCVEDAEKVAIKRVLQDPQYKNRELQIMRQMKHVNIIYLKDYYFTKVTKGNDLDVYLNVVMDYIPQNVHQHIKLYSKNNKSVPLFLVKLYAYQLCRAVAYLHSKKICHRDLKPQNLLIDPNTHSLKLCDFGSAKMLHPGNWSIAYICSRFYRAPELMLGCTDYTTNIDLWSVGCIIAEMILGSPLFCGDSSVNQLIRIIEVLGTPTEEQMSKMNKNYEDMKFPVVKPKNLKKIFPKGTPDEAITFISKFLKYEPQERISGLEALGDPFFDELRDPKVKLPEYLTELPDLFNFSEYEIRLMSIELFKKIVPEHECKNYERWLNKKLKHENNE